MSVTRLFVPAVNATIGVTVARAVACNAHHVSAMHEVHRERAALCAAGGGAGGHRDRQVRGALAAHGRRVVMILLGLALVALALGGCATALDVSDTPSPSGAGSPAATSPARPGNVFGPESPHYFGTGGP